MPGKTETEIRDTRSVSLHAVWLKIVEFKIIEPCDRRALVPTLNRQKVAKVVEDYIAARAGIVARYKISDRIQRPKVAGLMAASILKVKPVEINDRDHSPVTYETMQANEILAFWYGIGVCAEGYPQEAMDKFIETPHFQAWQDDMLYLFEQHPDSADEFVMIFETISLSFFPDSLRRNALNQPRNKSVGKRMKSGIQRRKR